MLQEAQTKVSTLMAEVYGLRREKWEAQQALNQVVVVGTHFCTKRIVVYVET